MLSSGEDASGCGGCSGGTVAAELASWKTVALGRATVARPLSGFLLAGRTTEGLLVIDEADRAMAPASSPGGGRAIVPTTAPLESLIVIGGTVDEEGGESRGAPLSLGFGLHGRPRRRGVVLVGWASGNRKCFSLIVFAVNTQATVL